ncbi:MAG TPA: hypothetical protein VKS98_13495 [Chthoniobacterales bacterium]|nr:hypothetical protein [Chthoniobacterales bacterium]
MNIRFLSIALIGACLIVGSTQPSQSQSSAQQPIIVQAATAGVTANTKSSQSAMIAENQVTTQAAIQTLEKIKAANDEVLKRQLATLQQLEEIQQAADELKIFAKRG